MNNERYLEIEAKKIPGFYLAQANDKAKMLDSFGAGFREGLGSRKYGELP